MEFCWRASSGAMPPPSGTRCVAISAPYARRPAAGRRCCRASGINEEERAVVNLTPREKDKLLVAMAAMVARRRLERGVKLNHPAAVALITDYVVEGARDGRSRAH